MDTDQVMMLAAPAGTGFEGLAPPLREREELRE